MAPSSSATSASAFKDALKALHGAPDVAALGGTGSILKVLKSSEADGLTTAQVALNRDEYGANVLPHKKPRPFWEHLMDAFEDSTLRILVASAVFSTLFGIFLSDSTADIIQVRSDSGCGRLGRRCCCSCGNVDGAVPSVCVVTATAATFYTPFSADRCRASQSCWRW